MKRKIIRILSKKFSKPLTCLTSYSPAISKILDGNVDIILVGDSLGTTLYGMKNLKGVTIEMMKKHGLAVTNNVQKSITAIDMPYKSYTNKRQALKNAKDIIKYTKAKLLKLEINKKNMSIIKYLSEKNFNIIAHIGVTPQSYNDFKKIKALGRTNIQRDNLIRLAINAEKAGAIGVLLECITQETAKKITSSISIPTIGIGSSKYCDGQILVFDDLININKMEKTPRFVKHYLQFANLAKKAVQKYSRDVKKGKYPNKRYSYK